VKLPPTDGVIQRNYYSPQAPIPDFWTYSANQSISQHKACVRGRPWLAHSVAAANRSDAFSSDSDTQHRNDSIRCKNRCFYQLSLNFLVVHHVSWRIPHRAFREPCWIMPGCWSILCSIQLWYLSQCWGYRILLFGLYPRSAACKPLCCPSRFVPQRRNGHVVVT
jgi:hypothetical protein